MRSGGRVVEGARLESVYTAKPYRGFESHPLRHRRRCPGCQTRATWIPDFGQRPRAALGAPPRRHEAPIGEERIMKFTRANPVTGQVASEAEAMTSADMAAVAQRAAAAFPVWSAQGPNARRAVLMKAAAALEARKDQFVEAMMGEIGATAGWAMFNLMLAAGMVREAAALTTQIGGEVIPSDKPGTLAMALREPVGVILGIAPWNAPIILGVRAIAVPLACGNTVILKASETCPRTHSLIVEAFAEAGFPEGAVQIVTNAPEDAGEVVGALIDAPEVRRINF